MGKTLLDLLIRYTCKKNYRLEVLPDLLRGVDVTRNIKVRLKILLVLKKNVRFCVEKYKKVSLPKEFLTRNRS